MGEPTGRPVFCSRPAQFGNNALSSDSSGHRELHKIRLTPLRARCFGPRTGLLALPTLVLAGCQAVDQEPVPPPAATAERSTQLCGEWGRLHAELYGAITGSIEWSRDELECAGMPRPEGRGARLRFAGAVADGNRRLALIIAIPELRRGETGDEYESNVTVIEEGGGRFFSTSTLGNCLTNITALAAADDSEERYSIAGTVYCVAPLAEVNGESSLSIRELDFSGMLDWSAS